MKYCIICDEAFLDKYIFCPHCGDELLEVKYRPEDNDGLSEEEAIKKIFDNGCCKDLNVKVVQNSTKNNKHKIEESRTVTKKYTDWQYENTSKNKKGSLFEMTKTLKVLLYFFGILFLGTVAKDGSQRGLEILKTEIFLMLAFFGIRLWKSYHSWSWKFCFWTICYLVFLDIVGYLVIVSK